MKIDESVPSLRRKLRGTHLSSHSAFAMRMI